MVGLEVRGDARGSCTGSASGAELGGVGWEGRVEPEHVGSVVVPEGEGENHASGERVAHVSESTQRGEGVGVAEDGLLVHAESVGDLVGLGDSGDVGLRVLVDDTIHDVLAADLRESTGGGAIRGDELSDDGNLGVSVDGLAGAIEGGVAHAVGVEIASVLVADTLITFSTVTALGTFAAVLAVHGADVGSVGSGDGVSLPDIHLIAASAVATRSGVDVVARGSPVQDIGLTVDKLQVVRALGIAVTSSVFGTGLVGRVLGHTAVLVHLDEIEGTVKTTRKIGRVNIKSEFLVLKVEHLVRTIALHEVDT